jgi:proteic killer suppression protein
MRITFGSRRMAKTFNKEKKLRREFGAEMARVIRRRLDDLRAATCLEDMRNLPGRCHELSGNRKGTLSLDLRKQYRLLFRPAVDPLPRKPDGGLDWAAVDAVQITEVEDTHGK